MIKFGDKMKMEKTKYVKENGKQFTNVKITLSPFFEKILKYSLVFLFPICLPILISLKATFFGFLLSLFVIWATVISLKFYIDDKVTII